MVLCRSSPRKFITIPKQCMHLIFNGTNWFFLLTSTTSLVAIHFPATVSCSGSTPFPSGFNPHSGLQWPTCPRTIYVRVLCVHEVQVRLVVPTRKATWQENEKKSSTTQRLHSFLPILFSLKWPLAFPMLYLLSLPHPRPPFLQRHLKA